MRTSWASGLAAIAGLGMTMPAVGQGMAMAPCAAPVAAGGYPMAWKTPATLSAAADVSHLAQATIAVGKAARVALLLTPDVRYLLRPEKPGGSVSHGGLLAFDIADAGTYRVALGSGAWIDLIGNGKVAMVSSAYTHGPACTGVHKMVDFPLAAGHDVLQISANGEVETEVLIVRVT